MLVIGAGAVGLFSAYELLKRGFAVTVIDRNAPDELNCSYGNAGYICPSHVIPLAAPGMVNMALRMMLKPAGPFRVAPRIDPDFLAWSWRFWKACTPGHVARSAPVLRDLSLASRRCYEEFASLPGNDIELRQQGLLNLCRTSHCLEEEKHLADLATQLGVEARILSLADVQAMEPAIRMEGVGAVYFPGDWHLTPARLMACLKKQIEQAGGEIRWNTDLLGFRREGSAIRAARTYDGEIEAGEFVLSAGAWSSRIASDLQLKLPIQAGKGYSLTIPDPPVMPRIPAILTEARVAVTPMGGSLRFGGTMEIAGIDLSINPRRVAQIVNSVSAYLPDFHPRHFAGITAWSGLRPCSPDGLPYIGRTRCAENLTIATGHAMLGISLAGITGRLVGQTIGGESPEIRSPLLSPDRFQR